MKFVTLLKSKIHHARVTDVRLDYEGSLTIDPVLMKKVGILPCEQIHVFNVENGARFITYAIEGKPGAGEFIVNGAAARLASKGDRLIIVTYVTLPLEEASKHEPQIIRLDISNKILA